MTVVKWKPARSLFPLSGIRNFDSLVSDFFPRRLSPIRDFDFGWSPNVDVSETEEAYELRAELPGIEKKEIEVSFKDDVLTISGEKKREAKKDDKANRSYYHESYYGTFERSFRFAQPVKDEHITATFKNGILDIKVPKSEVTEQHKVAIK